MANVRGVILQEIAVKFYVFSISHFKLRGSEYVVKKSPFLHHCLMENKEIAILHGGRVRKK